MQTYVIKFDRIGRTREIEPLTATVAGEADLCRAIRTYARPHLRSRDFDVMIDEDRNRGWIACGMHSGGDFTISQPT